MNKKSPYLSDISEFKESAIHHGVGILCGAGISKPSGLPLAKEVKQHILEKMSVDDEDTDKIMNSNIPFEAFMEAVSGNADISEILDIYKHGEPNTNHILIAKLAKKGYLKTIFTTNFDLLIERALENEGLKIDEDFEVYFDEEQFSRIDFDDVEDKPIRVFKIHGSIDNEDSVRTTMKAVASKTLSDKRMNLIRHLFSTGKHKKVLILGYSCSDVFDITPQIQSIEENQKEIIFIKHSTEGKEEIEDIKIKPDKNPFKKFNGERIRCDTDKFIKELWNSFEDTIGEYKYKKSKVEWTKYVDGWSKILKENSALQYFIPSLIFYSISDFKKAIEYYERSLEIAKEIGDKAGESICYAGLGTAYHDLGDFKKAIEYYERSLEIFKEIGNKAGESTCYTGLGNAYLNLGDFKKAIGYYERSLEIKKEIGDKAGESTCYTGLGNAYHDLGDFKKAIGYYERSLEIKKEIGDKAGESICYAGLGTAYHDLGNIKKAIEYHERSLEIFKEIGNKAGESICYAGLGTAYHDLGNIKKAIEYYERSLEIAKEIGDKAGESICYGNLGTAYHDLGNIKKAIEYYERSLEIAKEIGDKAGESTSYTNLGVAYRNLGDFKKAIEYYLKAERIFKETGQIHYLETVYKYLSIAYKYIGDDAKAEEYKKNS